jgi:hypothetical protein
VPLNGSYHYLQQTLSDRKSFLSGALGPPERFCYAVETAAVGIDVNQR